MNIGERIRVARVVAGMRQVDMAERLGVTNTTVCRWETGSYEVRIGMVLRIEELLGVSILVPVVSEDSVMDELVSVMGGD